MDKKTTSSGYIKVRNLILMAALDAVIVFTALLLGIVLGEGHAFEFGTRFFTLFVFNLIVCAVMFWGFRLYGFVFKNAGVYDALRIIIACLCVAAANGVYHLAFHKYSVQQLIIYIVLLTAFVGLSRFAVRIDLARKYAFRKTASGSKRVLIVGAGSAGGSIARELALTNMINSVVVAFVDDAVDKQGMLIEGVKVVGKTQDIPWVSKKYEIDEIIIAMPSSGKKVVKRIYDICKETNKPVKTVPGIYQLVNGEIHVSSIRPVNIADLLGREEVHVNLDEITKYVTNEVVLVTGGGGSIGSELCRQIAQHNPKQLIIFEIYENNAYDIEQELKRHCPNLNLLTLIGSIRDSGKLEDVFKTYKPTIVFNAAAHKHVPLMETSPNEAIKNNAIGTWKLARTADKYKVKTFVQISTDKAVNPTNIMGASKRICEMIIQTIGKNSKNTNFVAVRFGNVLGSNGSVIPLFEKQIREGGPVTLTHKDIVRYFMTIPEAVSLVLEAGAYAKKGQIFVLDMGDPVKIYDLAYNLIKLSGLTPGKDIKIVETGLRPGEKLYEERLMDEEGLEKTANGLISVAKPIDIKDEKVFWEKIDNLYNEAYKETDKMKDLVADLVPTYIRKD